MLDEIIEDDSGELADILASLTGELEYCRLRQYEPHEWQKRLHEAGLDHAERMASAANRVGKTYGAAHEMAFHLTGLYPDWWEGFRVDGPDLYWVGSQSNEQLRDVTQKELLGGLGEAFGTGAIPKMALGKTTKKQAGIDGVIDTVEVTFYRNGDTSKPEKRKSILQFKSYEQGWQKFQGTAPKVIWLDEEPDYKIFTECQTRLGTSRGRLMITFTPLSGRTPMVQHFYEDKPGTFLITAGWDDVDHLDEDWKREQILRYPAHERDARTKGIPILGTGRVFAYSSDEIRVKPFEIPDYWAQIIGIDFGTHHPAATVKVAHDRDNDIIYVTYAHKKKGMEVHTHCEVIKRAGGDRAGLFIPVTWPHDGHKSHQQSKGGLQKLYKLYREHNISMLSRSARYEEEIGGAQGVEPIVKEVDDRIATGRFKVFSTCGDFFPEFDNYHRNDKGVIVDHFDDILKAAFYAVMDIRKARPLQRKTGFAGRAAPIKPIAH